VDRGFGLPLSRQCDLFGVSCSSQYYELLGESAEHLALMLQVQLVTPEYTLATCPKSGTTSTGDRATAYLDETGACVVRDDGTGQILQVSNRLDKDWIPDPTIVDPYTP